MDQKQAGAAAIPSAGPDQSWHRTLVGLPHLQSATLDPLAKYRLSSRDLLAAGKKKGASNLDHLKKMDASITITKNLCSTLVSSHLPLTPFPNPSLSSPFLPLSHQLSGR